MAREEKLKNLKTVKRELEGAHQLVREYAITLYKVQQGQLNLKLPAVTVKERLITIGHQMSAAELALNSVIIAELEEH